MSNQAEIQDQIATLRNEVASLTRSLSRRSGEAFSEIEDRASDLYGYVQDRGPEVAREIRKQARYVEHTARENPITTLAVLAGAVLLVGALLRR
ncbi:MAG: DUF883 family protein [Rhizobiaceae bacterium]|nr:DUF883 family protein [Rhizobiaceae bacterium]